MSTGKALAIALVGWLVTFAVIDIMLWFLEMQTMSQWVIYKTKRSKHNKLLARLFCAIIIGVGIWLLFHFEIV